MDEVDLCKGKSGRERSGHEDRKSKKGRNKGERDKHKAEGMEEMKEDKVKAFFNREISVKENKKMRRKKGQKKGDRSGKGTVQETFEGMVICLSEDEDDGDRNEETDESEKLRQRGTRSVVVKVDEKGGRKRKDRGEDESELEVGRPESSSSGINSESWSVPAQRKKRGRNLEDIKEEVSKLEEKLGAGDGLQIEGVLKSTRVAKRLLDGIRKDGWEEEACVLRRLLDMTGEYMLEVGIRMGRLEGEIGVWRSRAEKKELRKQGVVTGVDVGRSSEMSMEDVREQRQLGSAGLVEMASECEMIGGEVEEEEVGDGNGGAEDVLEVVVGEDLEKEMVETRQTREEDEMKGSGLLERNVARKRPQIKIFDLDKDMTETQIVDDILYGNCDERWSKEVFRRNFVVVAKIDGEIVEGRRRVHWVVEVAEEILKVLVELKWLNIGGERSRCKSFMDVPRCFRCQRYGHIAKRCNKEFACGRCAGQHHSTICKSTKMLECINCRRIGRRGHHPTNSSACPVLQKEEERYWSILDRELK